MARSRPLKRRVRPASLNLPGHADKRRLAPPKKRARAAFRALNAANRNVVGIQELSTVSRRQIRRFPRWRLVEAKPNNVFRRNTITNAIAYRRDLFALMRVRHVNIPMRGRPRGLNYVIADLRDRGTGEEFSVMSFHAPRRKLDPIANGNANGAARRFLDEAKRDGKAALLIGDTNNPRARFPFTDFVVRDGVDVIAGVNTKDRRRRKPQTGLYTDHKVPMADLNLRL